MVALLTDSFGLKSSKLAQLDSTKFDEEPKNADSVLGRGQNQGKITVSDTKMPILCSGGKCAIWQDV